MKQLTVISGKGGTGKTTITAALSSLAANAVIADCDVDAADLHLILAPVIKKEQAFIGGVVASIDPQTCTQCCRCMELCRFDAINAFRVDPLSCEGCGVCASFCPEKAVTMTEKISGRWFVSDTRNGPMVHAKLGIAEDNSGKLVSAVRREAKKIVEQKNFDCILVDGPPGIGCPVIASITGVDLVVIVSEPTLSGLHDLERVAATAEHFNIPALACINKYDINYDMTAKIIDTANHLGITTVAKIPYNKKVIEAMTLQKTLIEHPVDAAIHFEVEKLWDAVLEKLKHAGS